MFGSRSPRSPGPDLEQFVFQKPKKDPEKLENWLLDEGELNELVELVELDALEKGLINQSFRNSAVEEIENGIAIVEPVIRGEVINEKIEQVKEAVNSVNEDNSDNPYDTFEIKSENKYVKEEEVRGDLFFFQALGCLIEEYKKRKKIPPDVKVSAELSFSKSDSTPEMYSLLDENIFATVPLNDISSDDSDKENIVNFISTTSDPAQSPHDMSSPPSSPPITSGLAQSLRWMGSPPSSPSIPHGSAQSSCKEIVLTLESDLSPPPAISGSSLGLWKRKTPQQTPQPLPSPVTLERYDTYSSPSPMRRSKTW